MKRKFIFKLIAGSVVSTTLFTGMPLKANGAWKQDNQGNYYFDEGNGYSSGWRNIDGKIYFFNNNGVMQRGWINYDNSWYFLDDTGILKNGWINYNNNWYYSNSAGVMQTGIINVNGSTYYLADNGVMQTKNMIIDGQFYTIGSNGMIVGNNIPAPDKVFDMYGNCIQSNISGNDVISPIDQIGMQEMKDESEIGDYAPPTRKFTIKFRSYDGEELDSKTVKEGNSIKTIDADSREGYEFIGWNTKSDGTGKSYDEGDKVKVTSDITLYAVYEKEEEVTLINSIEIKGDKEVQVGAEVQLTASIKPSNATNTKVKWSVENAGGEASVDANGNVKGIKEGAIKVKAEAEDKSGKSAVYTMNVVAAKTLVSSIEISADNKADKISENGGTLQLKSVINPKDADNQKLSWSIVDKDGNKVTGKATVDSNGLVTAIADTEEGEPIYVMAVATDGSGTTSNKYKITISGQTAKVDRITIKNSEKYLIIKEDGNIRLKAVDNNGTEIEPIWIVDDTSKAEITDNNNLKGKSQGTIKVTAKYGGKTATKTLQVIQPATHINITAKNNGNDVPLVVNTSGGSLDLVAKLLGENNVDATNQKVTWSLDKENSTGEAVLGSSSGKFTAVRNGKVVVVAKSIDQFGIGESVTTSAAITITSQKVPVNKITLFKEENGVKSQFEGDFTMHVGGATTESQVTVIAETSALHDSETPDDGKVKWTFMDGTTENEYAEIEQTDDSNKITIKASKPGKITLKAEAADGSGKTVTQNIIIKKYISGITFVPHSIEATSGKSILLNAVVDGVDLYDTSNITNDLYNWSIVGSEDNASINEYGTPNPVVKEGELIIYKRINIKNVGNVKVKVEAKDGSGKSALLEIVIKPCPATVTISSENASIKAGEQVQLSAVVLDDNSINSPIQKVIWSITSSNKDQNGDPIVTENGSTNTTFTLTGENPGDVTVVAKAAEDDSIQSREYKITIKPKEDAGSGTAGASE